MKRNFASSLVLASQVSFSEILFFLFKDIQAAMAHPLLLKIVCLGRCQQLGEVEATFELLPAQLRQAYIKDNVLQVTTG